MIIRKAIVNDAEPLTALLEQLGYQMSVDEMKKRIKAHRCDNYIFVAVLNEKIVGVLACGLYELFRLPGKCCHIDSLIVDSGYRGQGIGKKLIAFIESHAKEKGALHIELISSNHRKKDGTHAFYKQLGFSDHSDVNYTYFLKRDI